MRITARKWDGEKNSDMLCIECDVCGEHVLVWETKIVWDRNIVSHVDLESQCCRFTCTDCAGAEPRWNRDRGDPSKRYGVPKGWKGWISDIRHEHGKTTITRTYSESSEVPEEAWNQ